MSGKYACPKGGQEWLDTSLMTDTLEHLLDLRVYQTYTVCDESQVHVLYDWFDKKMEACEPLGLGTGTTLRNHRLYPEVLSVYVTYRENAADDDVGFEEEGLAHATALVIYQKQDGGLLGFQFLNDVHEDMEADEYISELRKTIPEGNQGGS